MLIIYSIRKNKQKEEILRVYIYITYCIYIYITYCLCEKSCGPLAVCRKRHPGSSRVCLRQLHSLDEDICPTLYVPVATNCEDE